MTNKIDMARSILAGGAEIDEDTVEHIKFVYEYNLKSSGLLEHTIRYGLRVLERHYAFLEIFLLCVCLLGRTPSF